MFIVMLLFSGIDMIGDMPERVTPPEECLVPIIHEEATSVDPPVEKRVEPPVIKRLRTRKVVKFTAKPEEPECVPEEEPTPESEVASEESPDVADEEKMIPFPEGDKLEPGEKEVEAADTSEEGYKYYVYRSHNCAPCKWLVDELQKNVDEKDLILSYERTTKSGKYVTYVPVLEVYKDGKLVHQQTGYTSWKTIQGKLSATD